MVNKLSNFYRHNRFVNIYTLIFIIILVSFTSCNSLEKNTPPYIIDVQAHRGGMGLRPANTLEAMLHAVTLGVNTLELDIAVTRDGHIVMSHDLWLDYLNTIKPDGTEMKEDDP